MKCSRHVIVDPGSRQFEGNNVGLLYTLLSRVTTFQAQNVGPMPNTVQTIIVDPGSRQFGGNNVAYCTCCFLGFIGDNLITNIPHAAADPQRQIEKAGNDGGNERRTV